MRKNIVIDLLKLKDLYCGLGQVSLNFGNALSKIQHENINWHFLVPEDYIGYFGDIVNYVTKKNVLLLRDIDLWHSIHQEPKILPKYDCKRLLTIHDLNFIGEKSERKSQKRLKKLQTIIDNTDDLCFISEYSRVVANEHLQIKKETGQSVIYNGVELSPDLAKPWFKIENDFFFSIGVIKPKKNFKVLLPMMQLFPDIDLVIAGNNKGAYANMLKKEIKKLNLESRVHLPGIITDAEKNWLYSNCKAFVFPSLYEGFGLPIIEAMRFGSPIICYKGSSLPEIGGTHAFYWDSFSPEDMKNTLVDGIEAYKNSEIAEKAVQYASSFTWEKNAELYLKKYVEILKIN
ncbi:MAG: glycosyltransferase family 1 protein [Bacteroidales bacterium]|nr:glycosyltransferase family 1 protein [Bacteroidales bacterium]